MLGRHVHVARIFIGGACGMCLWDVKAQTCRAVWHVPQGKFQKTWVALSCISRVLMVEKENTETLKEK